MQTAGHEKSSAANGMDDPFKAARKNLYPPLRNRKLGEAADALASGRIDLAESLITQVLKKTPRDPSALNLMADIARRAQRFEEAERLLSKCVAQDPRCAGYRFNYAVILRRLDRLNDALVQLDKLLRNDPQNPLFREQKADVLAKQGNYAAALEERRALAEEYPYFSDIWIDYGDLLRTAGHQEQAVAVYQHANTHAPDRITGYIRLADLKTYRFSEAETARMQTHLASPNLSKDERADLYFALGKAYGDEKRYAESFDSYAKGNALQRAGVDFDPERLTTHRLNCERLFTKNFFRQRNGWGCESRAPIFIVGMPRSGSTLIEQILSSHSEIEGLEELAELDNTVGARLARFDGGQPYQYWIGGWFEFRSGLTRAFPKALSQWNAQDFQAIGEEYLAAIQHRRKSVRSRFTDKALRNFGYAGLIPLILPNAKIIDARRHPLDCGWSCFVSRFPGGQPFAYRLADIGRHYANYARLMARFDRMLPGRMHRVVYEDLIADPEIEVRRLLAYLDLPFEEGCLRFHENKRAVNTLSSAQVRVPLYKTGMAQWQPYERWLGPLKASLGDVLEHYRDVPDQPS